MNRIFDTWFKKMSCFPYMFFCIYVWSFISHVLFNMSFWSMWWGDCIEGKTGERMVDQIKRMSDGLKIWDSGDLFVDKLHVSPSYTISEVNRAWNGPFDQPINSVDHIYWSLYIILVQFSQSAPKNSTHWQYGHCF